MDQVPTVSQKLLYHKRASGPVGSAQGSPLWGSLLFSKKAALVLAVPAPAWCKRAGGRGPSSLAVPPGTASLNLGAGGVRGRSRWPCSEGAVPSSIATAELERSN